MKCSHHKGEKLLMICLSPHKCIYNRKLCLFCFYSHDVVDKSQTIPIKTFREEANNKMNECVQNELSIIIALKNSLKFMKSKTEQMLKTFCGQVSELIEQIQNSILSQHSSYRNLVSQDSILAESTQEDLESLIQIVQGEKLGNWRAQKNSCYVNLGKLEKSMEQEINILQENFKNYYEQLSQIKQKLQQYQSIKLFQQEDHPYEWKEDLYEVLASVKEIDEQIFAGIIKMLSKEQNTDSIQFLQADYEEKYLQQFFSSVKLSSLEQSKNLNNTFKDIANILKNIDYLDFNKKNYYQETCIQQRRSLIAKISKEKNILQFLKFLVHLTSLDNQFIQCGSNSLSLLVEMKVDLKNQRFQGIKIKNTALIGANFFRCNFSKSQFDTVFICGINLNDTQLFNCNWKNLTIKEQHELDGKSSTARSVCFSPDGTILASRSCNFAICLWDVQTEQEKANLDGHSSTVRSVCFSPDGTILASGSDDKSVRLWDVNTGIQKAKLIGHSSTVRSLCFSPDGTILASGSDDKSIRLWDARTGLEKQSFFDLSSNVLSICFSSNGAILASICGDETINILDAIGERGKQQNTLNCLNSIDLQALYSDDNLLEYTFKNNYINFWEVKSGKKIKIQNSYDIFEQFETPIDNINLDFFFFLGSPQSRIFQAQGALILKGEFVDSQGRDLRSFFKTKGSYILETQIQPEQQ